MARNDKNDTSDNSTPISKLDTEQLIDLVKKHNLNRGKAVFELAHRARTDDVAASQLGELTRLPHVRDDRLFHRISLAWAGIIGLLAAETSQSRDIAYRAFTDLDKIDQKRLLMYLHCERIEDAHPQI